MFKKIILIFSVISLFAIFIFQSISFFRNSFEKNNFPAVIFFDVGQGDATLLRNINGKNILIDGGPANRVLENLGQFLAYTDKKIDLIIVSHAHSDHVSGLLEVLRRYEVGKVILASGLSSGKEQDELIKLAADRLLYVAVEIEIDLGGCNLILFNPLSLNIKDNDNNSLITKLDCIKQDFLLAGDNEKELEQKILFSDFDISADIFKASHHGSATSNTVEFLEAINPEIMIVSAGLNNKFKHPSPLILQRAEDLGISTLVTYIEGDLVFAVE